MPMTVNTSGLMSSSGFDVQALVDQMIQAAQLPEQVWKNQQTALGSQASALNALSSKLAALDNSVTDLNDILGPFAQRTATSSNDAVISATASTSASVGQHSIAINSLATKAVYYSEPSAATGDTPISGGTLSITIGSVSKQINVDQSTNSLSKIASKINGFGIGITASVITDASGAKLTVASNTTGAASDFTLTTSSDSAIVLKKTTDGANLVATIDGVPVSSATNRLENVISGVMLDLHAKTVDVPVVIDIATDSGRVSQAITGLVNNYNALVSAINAQFTYDQTSGTAGPLASDATVRTLQQQLMQAIGSTKVSSSATPTLRSLGIKMADDGTLSIDSPTLSHALASNFSAVTTFFQDSQQGLAAKLGTLMNALTDSVKGPLVVDLKGIKDTQSTLANTITDFEDRLVFKRQQLVEQFSQINAILQALPTKLNEIDAMLGSLNTSSTNKK
jgi:flagellar hook-associated protein 2